ncbi:unnamed protein product [Amoebophrya sp. A25]|nr:unnamed protein product [Amoebophrya sp. A25]|eukprot:GSA25T00009698001.1
MTSLHQPPGSTNSRSSRDHQGAPSPAQLGGYLILCSVDLVTNYAKGSLESRFECTAELVQQRQSGGQRSTTSSSSSSSNIVEQKQILAKGPVPSTSENHILLDLSKARKDDVIKITVRDLNPGRRSKNSGAQAAGGRGNDTKDSTTSSNNEHQEEEHVGRDRDRDSASTSTSLMVGSCLLSCPQSFSTCAENSSRGASKTSPPLCNGGVYVLDRWMPLDGARYQFERGASKRSTTSVSGASISQLRVLCKYVPADAAIAESDIDRTFHCQDILILALQSLSVGAVSSPQTGGGGGINPGGTGGSGSKKHPTTRGQNCEDDVVLASTQSSNRGALTHVAAPFLFVSDGGPTTQAASATSGPNALPFGSRMASRASVRNSTVGGDTAPPSKLSVNSGGMGTSKNVRQSTSAAASQQASAQSRFTVTTPSSVTLEGLKSRAVNFAPPPRGSGGSVVFRNLREFEESCAERTRPYQEMVELLETKLEAAGLEKEDVEIYKRAANSFRTQHNTVQDKLRESLNLFESRITEQNELVEQKTAEIAALQAQVNEVRASRDSLLDEVTLSRNAAAMSETSATDLGVLQKQVKVFDKLLKDEKAAAESSAERREKEIVRLRDELSKFQEQMEQLAEHVTKVEGEKMSLADRLKKTLGILTTERKQAADWRLERVELSSKVESLEADLRTVTYNKSLVQDLKNQVTRQEEQLETRSKQMEDMKSTFEAQLNRELETQKRLIREKQEATQLAREANKKASPTGMTPLQMSASNLQTELKLQSARVIELEHKLSLAGDVEREKDQALRFAESLEKRIAELLFETEEGQKKFESHLANEKDRTELLEKDNADLKKLLQEIQPEFHKLQTELEQSSFQVKEMEARCIISDEEKLLQKELKDQFSDLGKANEDLRAKVRLLEAEIVDRNTRLWNEYIPAIEQKRHGHGGSAASASTNVGGGGPPSSASNSTLFATSTRQGGYQSQSSGQNLSGSGSSSSAAARHHHLLGSNKKPRASSPGSRLGAQSLPGSNLVSTPGSSSVLLGMHRVPVGQHDLPMQSINYVQNDSGTSGPPGDSTGTFYRYTPCKGDAVDRALAQMVNAAKPPVPFYRLSAGIYLYGSRKVLVKLTKQNRLIFRVGGGYCSFEQFLERFSTEAEAGLGVSEVWE